MYVIHGHKCSKNVCPCMFIYIQEKNRAWSSPSLLPFFPPPSRFLHRLQTSITRSFKKKKIIIIIIIPLPPKKIPPQKKSPPPRKKKITPKIITPPPKKIKGVKLYCRPWVLRCRCALVYSMNGGQGHREGLKKSLKLQTLSEQGEGSENYPLCLNPISEFLI